MIFVYDLSSLSDSFGAKPNLFIIRGSRNDRGRSPPQLSRHCRCRVFTSVGKSISHTQGATAYLFYAMTLKFLEMDWFHVDSSRNERNDNDLDARMMRSERKARQFHSL